MALYVQWRKNKITMATFTGTAGQCLLRMNHNLVLQMQKGHIMANNRSHTLFIFSQNIEM